jgi:hypothetical protein
MAAKKKPSKTTSARTLEGPRILTQDVPAYQGTYDAVNSIFPIVGEHGWYNEGLPNAIAWEGYFDLSGYTQAKLTWVPEGCIVQDPGRFIAEELPGVDVEVLDIISQERLSLTQIDLDLLIGNCPGGPATTQDHEQIIFGQYRLMSTNNTLALDLLTTVGGGTFGSGQASAAAKLWFYKIIRINGNKTELSELRIPASNFIMPGVAVKEADLPYMMRLKRSYEISTQG